MLIIRLQRAGKRHKPEFRIILAEKQSAASKKFQEILGYYNPRNKAFTVKDEPRLKYWIDQHVELSPTVHNLFINKELMTGSKVQAFKVPKKPAEQAPTESGGVEPVAEEAPAVAPAAEAPADAPAEAAPEVPTEVPAPATPEVAPEAPSAQ